ncbi:MULTISPECIES: hypothetical protein [Brevibacillus]|uniref:hypothetical protein n=1 Tax=Brevibacillus TaxID=55080 RepID=UPI0018EC2C4E|nr:MULTISPECIES: hypothetical protein [Brevibacillus]MED1948647.1 hypothetical protein [Brevibacillus formosus]MED2000346.1 hypothetical protein [Brevibacillus formosus]MED2085632.1 hypothetical protein [Brevibacillus formosus]
MECKAVVADDEQTIVIAIAYALVREGFQVEVAAAGGEALRKVSRTPIASQLSWSPDGQRLALSIFGPPQVFTTIYQLKPFNITE